MRRESYWGSDKKNAGGLMTTTSLLFREFGRVKNKEDRHQREGLNVKMFLYNIRPVFM